MAKLKAKLKLKPLQQWFCDTCGEVIEEPSHGMLVFKRSEDSLVTQDIAIVHHAMHGPRADTHHRGSRPPCYPKWKGFGDMHLEEYAGLANIGVFVAILDPGPALVEELEEPEANVRSWAETFRRLYVAHYEEARKYIEDAARIGRTEGWNEASWSDPEGLKRMILDMMEEE